VGQTLAASASNLNGSGTISYQWLRNGSTISGATGSSYTLVSADEGASIKVRVSRSGMSGSVESTPVGPVTGGGSGSDTPADYKGTYTGAIVKSDYSQMSSGATLTDNAIIGGSSGVPSMGAVTISNVSFGSDNDLTAVVGGSSVKVGTWAYIYSGGTKIGVVWDISYNTQYASRYLILGKTQVDTMVSSLQTVYTGLSSVVTSDMDDTYQGSLNKS
jgi:hypothetical protein